MILIIFTLIVIGIVALSQYRSGIFTSATMLIQVLIAGLVTFGFWEPIADALDAAFQEGKLAGYEDCIVLTGLFAITVLVLRLITNTINGDVIDFNPIAQQVGGPLIGVITGYLLAGFLICVFETLPIEDNFLGFAPRRPDESGLRRYVPPDRVWLALMRHAGAYPLAWSEEDPNGESAFDRWATFDRQGTFEMRYLRNRRHVEGREPLPYFGEFDKELGRKR